MSYFLFDFENDKQFEFDNLIIDEKIAISDDSNKYLIFYDKNNAKELYLKIPRIRLTYDWTNIKYNNIKLRLTPKYSKINNFTNFLSDFENYIVNCKTIKKKNLDFISILEKEKNIYYLKTFLNENKILITSDSGKKIKFTDFKNNGEIQIIIKISGVWQKNNKFGLSTQIYQIKYYNPPEDNFIDMIDMNESIKDNKINKKDDKILNDTEIIKPIINYSKPLLGLDPKMLQSVKLKPIEHKN
jgi:hypothetical protein